MPSAETWQHDVPRLRAMWDDLKARWPREVNPPPDRTGDEPGSWRGDSGRALSASQNRRIDAWCDEIGDCEQRITQRLEEVEQASSGQLAGKEYRIKGRDALKDKVAARLENDFDLDLDGAVTSVHDAVRYTYRYDDETYAGSVTDDIARMKEQGFNLVKMQNHWVDREYKGINSHWRDDETGRTFEMQYHTTSSFEAKQLTHGAYECLRVGQIARAEARQFHAFQREVSARIPIPRGAERISNYP
jgi:hypothetical protein